MLLSRAGWLLLAMLPAVARSVHKELVSLVDSDSGQISLDAKTFELLTSDERDWSAVVQFTASGEEWNCAACFAFDPVWKTVSRAWWEKGLKAVRDKHFFATLDFDGHDGDERQAIFQRLGLNTAPVVLVYPAVKGPRAARSGKPLTFDLSSAKTFDAVALAAHLSEFTPAPIPLYAPIDFRLYIGRGLLFSVGAFGLYVAARLAIFRLRWIWAAGSVVFSLVMTSGFMFIRIREVPLTGRSGSWVAKGMQQMYGMEMRMVAPMYALLGLAFYMLTAMVPKHTSSRTRQRIFVYLWSVVIVVFYSVLVVFIKVKNPHYPFRLIL
ncbi:Oligosaccharyl transferase subunit OST3/OST6 family [Mycena indigotica]|uniref:Oligosaccharyl transferase subunit OST3/OST6 family n=1 Tax=Mycena indigotica TaxID=2126181 RepID=A0A8H6WHS8_9AGAR|nr:Oligosaccharyl transferase subunit OST3/OST6 family [Mycena indigotica]KAF7312759.1 Oligosaccharyl transferase subunit OST3/OST6 family [Mycena indigotica]